MILRCLSRPVHERDVLGGRVAALSHDTLTLEIPRDTGMMVFPRNAISEVAVPNRRESRWADIGLVAPLFVTPVVFATATVSGPHATASEIGTSCSPLLF